MVEKNLVRKILLLRFKQKTILPHFAQTLNLLSSGTTGTDGIEPASPLVLAKVAERLDDRSGMRPAVVLPEATDQNFLIGPLRTRGISREEMSLRRNLTVLIPILLTRLNEFFPRPSFLGRLVLCLGIRHFGFLS
jgi:hypothetical protein